MAMPTTKDGSRHLSDDGEDQSSRKLFRGEIHAAMQIPGGRAFQRSGICIWVNVGIRPYADYK
ncbi:hypothetical protein ALC56_06348 [Trachymyrmex septentrionalis]|uniref:Uncharacterized protein n=1 Tax=Trachymyrmex septentrionalis TaxID=34720 RepID=A0A195FFY8_9HYME|nr:hypothetical protein ALC56_06348 [Trachymyrmex septentrionalis]